MDQPAPISDAALPRCLHTVETQQWGPALTLARCRYEPDILDADAFAAAHVTLPAALESAVAKRRTEYLAGRVCARAALQHALGLAAIPEIGADRAPRWPDGAVGAITHSHGHAAALVGSARHWQGIGLDAEHWLTPARARRLGAEILTREELDAQAGLADDTFAHQLTRVFSIKESLFKALYPITGKRFYFQDAAIAADSKRITLRRTLSEQWRAGRALPYQYRDDDAGVLSWILVPC